MFNDGFYPTPPELVERMLNPFKEREPGHGSWRGWNAFKEVFSVLEPSAGKGDICEVLLRKFGMTKAEIKVIEKEPQLQDLLRGAGYDLIDSDFLTYSDPYRFDLIVMNPPFDDGASHLLKAWEVVAAGGRIACLLNAETVRNPGTNERAVLAEIIKRNGSFEYAGQPFKTAERPTDVEVVIVWLCKPEKRKAASFKLDGMDYDSDVGDAEFTANPLAHRDTVVNLVAKYDQAKRILIQLAELESEYVFYTDGVLKAVDESGKRLYIASDAELKTSTLSERVDGLKASFWDYVFNRTKIAEKTTSNFHREFADHLATTKRLAFTVDNIYNVLMVYIQNGDQIMMDCILEVFDKATAYHKDNKEHVAGWDHNKSWKIAPLIINPYGIRYEKGFNQWSTSRYGREDFYGDIDKIMCFLDGRTIDSITTINAAMQRRCDFLNNGYGQSVHPEYSEWFESTYFSARFYQKGTVHLKFKDKELLAAFNTKAAQGKKWVGAGF